MVDFATGTVRDPNRAGPGPQEFRLPGSLLRFRSDSTLLIDAGNSRIAILDRDGRIVRAFRASMESANSPFGVDSAGRLYYSVPPWSASSPLRGDSVELGVWDPATAAARVVSRVHGFSLAPRPTAPQDGPRVPIVIFAAQDNWAVAPDGRIAVVRGADYSVRWIGGSAPEVTGPSYAFPRARVTEADRTAWMRQFVAGSPVSGRGEDGGLGHTPASALERRNIAGMVRRSNFAETMPFFRSGELRIDVANRVWVSRTTPLGEPRRYDVFDSTGRLIAAFRLGPDRRLLGFGARHAYVVHTDDDDGLETLERVPLPVLPR